MAVGALAFPGVVVLSPAPGEWPFRLGPSCLTIVNVSTSAGGIPTLTATRLPRRFALLAFVALLSAGTLAVCGGSDDSSPADGNGSPVPTAAQGGTVPAGAPVIDQQDLAFKPDKLTVKAGDKVYFLNSETALHTVTVEGKNVSGTMKKGDVAVWTVPNAGTFKVTCDFHPQMKATITAQ